MPTIDHATEGFYGMYHDVLRDPEGRVLWDRGWCKNAIVLNCRLLLASFMRRAPPALGISGLFVGAGLSAWDTTGTPAPSPTQTALVDPFRFLFPLATPQITFLDPATGVPSPTPTNRIQIVATLGPGVPPWPDANHATRTLREFGLFGNLNGVDTLINYVTHPAIVKDPTSTLERTIWLTF